MWGANNNCGYIAIKQDHSADGRVVILDNNPKYKVKSVITEISKTLGDGRYLKGEKIMKKEKNTMKK